MGIELTGEAWGRMARHGARVAVLLVWAGAAFGGEATDSAPASTERGGGSVPLTLHTESLPLTRQDAVYLALLNSRDVKIERLMPRIMEMEISRERASLDPSFSMAAGTSQTQAASGNALAGTSNPQSESVNWSSGLRARLISGAVASLDFTNSRTEANSSFLTLNPQYSSNLVFALTQPLLKDFGPAINRTRVKLAENNRTISGYQLRARVAGILADVETAYWDLVLGFRDEAVRRKSLDLTLKLAERSRELVREGFLPEIAALQADAAVAQRQAEVSVAAAALRDTLSRLQDVLNLDPKGDVRIVPVDQPSLDVPSVDVQRAVRDALDRRPELPQAKLELKNRNLSLDVARNQRLPQLNLVFSYGLSGLAGSSTNASRSEATQAVLGRQQVPSSSLVGGYGTSLENLFSGDFPSWSVGMNLVVPLGNVAAESQFRKAELEVQKAVLTLRDVERKISLEVERWARQMESLRKAVDAGQAFREQAQRRLEMAQEQFDLGLASLSAVLEADRDVASAEREEWRTVVDYNKALALFDKATGATLQKYRVEF